MGGYSGSSEYMTITDKQFQTLVKMCEDALQEQARLQQRIRDLEMTNDALRMQLCIACDGTGAIDAPFSESDPGCRDCAGTGIQEAAL